MANTEQKIVHNDDKNKSDIGELSGKTVLIVGTSGPGLYFLWKILQDLNIKVSLLEKCFCDGKI